ncbi:MAG: sigma-54 interaction domain-containing protein [Hyphomicrobiaceae bacterium]
MPEGFGGILGDSAAIVALREYLPKVARSSATVLVTGETGTGKERVAQAVHVLSTRRVGPFVAINCAAFPETLVESELFGHERGAFTGALSARRGRIAEAHDGTLFLDEIGEMPMHMQAKLLRVLETREVVPVGGGRPFRADIRVVAATNQPLEQLVAEHRFRADLFYRLNVARIDLPPLRERREDVPLLFHASVAEFNVRHGLRVGPPEPELLDCLIAHDWPGNVRELRNLVEALFISPPSGVIHLSDLPPGFRRIFERFRQPGSPERDRLLAVLRQTHWNKTEAARALNWSRMTLYRKIAEYHIESAGLR